ncbi:MAG: DUF1622 domain-containing protein [Bdellovibrionaceae bacterium]|nr:DUF1622 domain-containing protein [Pseudobdellovibrionaceae bacterium]MBX3033986.1 DUF1622 domain-containing protein [Pseudobdellovibrionaceae bacterium]
MKELFKEFADNAALFLEAVAVILIMIGAFSALGQMLAPWLRRQKVPGLRRTAWLGFARWLLLGLEFTLAADIVRTAIAPTWDSIGQLAAIALIRTFLNYFLERDLETADRDKLLPKERMA